MTAKPLNIDDKKALLDHELQNFAREIGIICALEAGGKIDSQEAYYRIKTCWRRVKASKRELFPKVSDPENNQAG